MNANQRRGKANSVNGNRNIATLGKVSYDPQVGPDRYPTTRGEARCNSNSTNRIKNRELHRISTWNIRTLYQQGKFDNLKQEMTRLKVSIMGVSEVRWTRSGLCVEEDTTFYYSGGDKHEYGVGILLDKTTAKSDIGFWPVTDRIIMVKLQGHPFNINIIQVYAPTSTHSEEDLEDFYEQLNKVKQQCKSQDINIIMGDLNAKIGAGRQGRVVGPYGLGERNERGDRWAEWCEGADQIIINTWFRHHRRHLWTWKSPGDGVRNQIDYITINSRFRNAIRQAKTYPGADCNSDHVPIIAKLKVKLKTIKKKQAKPMLQLQLLRVNNDLRNRYSVEVQNRFDILCNENEDNTDANTEWSALQNSLVETANDMIPKVERKKKQKWMTEEILEMMKERRKFKDRN